MAPQRTAKKKKLVLDHVARGADVVEAAEAVEVGRATIYRWLKEDSDFAEEWEIVHSSRVHQLTTKAWHEAMDGSARLLTFLIDREDRRNAATGEVETSEQVGSVHFVRVGSDEDEGGEFIQFVGDD